MTTSIVPLTRTPAKPLLPPAQDIITVGDMLYLREQDVQCALEGLRILRCTNAKDLSLDACLTAGAWREIDRQRADR